MTRVSQYPLDPALLDVIKKEFTEFVAHASAIGSLSHFLQDFLTPTEMTMLSKRLMIAVLLKRGYNAETIKNRLSVSNSAIIGVNSWLKFPHPGTIKTFVERNHHKDFVAFIDKLEALLDKLPPGKYRNWKVAGQAKFARQKTRQLNEQLR